jgi:Rieske Fe-S protein
MQLMAVTPGPDKPGSLLTPTRRSLVVAASGAGMAAVLAACGSGSDSGSASDAPASDTPSDGDAPPAPSSSASDSSSPSSSDSSSDSGSGSGGSGGGTTLGKTSDIPVGGGLIFAGQKVVVTQPTAGQFKGFTAVCTHMGCTVAQVADGTIDCPCHGSKFNIADGSVANGPATSPLAAKPVTVSGDTLSLG